MKSLMISTLCCVLGVCCLTMQASAAEKGKGALSFEVKDIDGKTVDLNKQYHGKVVLIVNVASRCGATPQYAALQQLHQKYGKQGLVILGFPCNQFGKQEPGSEKEIQSFCTANYGVEFDMFSKIDVNGENADPLYQFLTSEQTNPQFAGQVRWNFEKFLIGRDGQILARFRTGVEPDAPEVIDAVEKALSQKN